MTKRDMTRPNWARTAARLRKMAAELRANNFKVFEPVNFDKPPAERHARGGAVSSGTAVVLGEDGPQLLAPWREGLEISPRRSGDHGLS
jgi:hypothetical protein